MNSYGSRTSTSMASRWTTSSARLLPARCLFTLPVVALDLDDVVTTIEPQIRRLLWQGPRRRDDVLVCIASNDSCG